MTRRFRSLAAEVGARRAAIFNEIRRCLRLRGGTVVDGSKWIYKTCRELAELLGVCIKTIERDLRLLVSLGWLERERHDARWGKQHYYYRLGPDAPLKGVSHESRPVVPPEPDNLSASLSSNTTSRNSLPATNSQTAKQPGTETVVYAAVRGVYGALEGGVAVPEHWPTPTTVQQTLLALENIRNTVPWLRKPQGFGAATA